MFSSAPSGWGGWECLWHWGGCVECDLSLRSRREQFITKAWFHSLLSLEQRICLLELREALAVLTFPLPAQDECWACPMFFILVYRWLLPWHERSAGQLSVLTGGFLYNKPLESLVLSWILFNLEAALAVQFYGLTTAAQDTPKSL